jgi:DnaK suppressor protein
MIVAKPTAKKAAKTRIPVAKKPAAAKSPSKTVVARPKAAAPAVKVKTVKFSMKPTKPALRSRSNIADKPGSSGSTNVLETVTKSVQVVSPLKAKDVELFRELLLAKRRELLGDVASMEQEALRSTTGSNLSNLPIHMADMGTDNYEQEFTLGLVEKDRQLLREIHIALDKIKRGTYGICEGTGKPITRARLEAKPWARYSLEYTIKVEKGLVRR